MGAKKTRVARQPRAEEKPAAPATASAQPPARNARWQDFALGDSTPGRKATPIQWATGFQAGPQIGSVSDPVEAEADRMADRALAMPEPEPGPAAAVGDAAPAVAVEAPAMTATPVTLRRQPAPGPTPFAGGFDFSDPMTARPIACDAGPVFGPADTPGSSSSPAAVAPAEPIYETREDPENARTNAEELTPGLPEDPLADAITLRAALGDRLWQPLEAAALRRESLRRGQSVCMPEGDPMASVTVDDVLSPVTYPDPGDAARVWAGLKGDAEPGEADQQQVREWAVARVISGFRASVADEPAVVALADPEAQEGGPSRLLLWVGGREIPLDTGLVNLDALDGVAPQSLTDWGDRLGGEAATMLKAKTLIVQGGAQLAASRELGEACAKDPGNAVVAALEQARRQATAIAFECLQLGLAAGPELTSIRQELDAVGAAATSTATAVDTAIGGVRTWQDRKMDVFGSSLDQFWRRADDVFVVGSLFSLLSAGDSHYRAERLQAIHDGTISYNQFDAEMNGWKEYLSAGVNMAINIATAKLAGPGASAVFGIDATWSPYVASATRNVFASFTASVGKDIAIGIASAINTSPDVDRFLRSQIASPTDALMGALPGIGMDAAAIRITRISPSEPGIGQAPMAPQGEAPQSQPLNTRRALDYPEDMQMKIAGNRDDAIRSGMKRTPTGQINWRAYEDQRLQQNRWRPGVTNQTTTRLPRGERFGAGGTQYRVRPDLSTQAGSFFEDAKMRDFSNNANVVDAAASIQKEIRAAEIQLGTGVMSAEFGIATTRELPRQVKREIIKRVAIWLRNEGYSTAQMNSFLERIQFTWALPK